jgi:hypothetical protein
LLHKSLVWLFAFLVTSLLTSCTLPVWTWLLRNASSENVTLHFSYDGDGVPGWMSPEITDVSGRDSIDRILIRKLDGHTYSFGVPGGQNARWIFWPRPSTGEGLVLFRGEDTIAVYDGYDVVINKGVKFRQQPLLHRTIVEVLSPSSAGTSSR